ncbi:MAG: lysine--tRNA ligase [Spirochaetia bacterium]|nr:lysine--tRNA ligase [Spirochaetia bacterium]
MSENNDDHSSENQSETELIQQRLSKYKSFTEHGINVYPNQFKRTHNILDVLEMFNTNDVPQNKVIIAGRVMTRRAMGKAGFLNIKDFSGQIQVYSNNTLLNENGYFVFTELDIGDIIGVSGETFKTKTGEPSIRVESITMLSKNLYPLPVVKEKDGVRFDAFADVEQRYRRRYLDLIVNPDVKNTFVLRSKIISEIRSFLIGRGFLEVETPMMHSIASGAAAKPFQTHHNTLGMDLFLRIAPELHLKRLIAGGFEKIFELNRNFRNEGISIKHNPEFTMMEIYQAYADYSDMMTLTEEIITHLVKTVLKTDTLTYGDKTISLKTPWEKKTYLGVIEEKTGLNFRPFLNTNDPSVEDAKKMAQSIGVDVKKCHTFWEVVDEVFSGKVEGTLIQPVFITDFPKAMSPLAKSKPEEHVLVERFEPYINGWEIGNAFTELNDPFDQKERFEQQVAMKKAGQAEVIEMDEDFIDVLRVGMPPTGGLGIGIDRLIMLMTNSPSIKDVILFPLLKKKEN